MNPFKVFSDLFARPKPVAREVSTTHLAFVRALAIVRDYRAILEKPNDDAVYGPLRSEKDLPHNKEAIRQAIFILQIAIASPAGRVELINALSPEDAQYVLSESFAKGLDSGLASLDLYSPETRLSEQKKLTKDIAKFMSKLTPVERKTLEELKMSDRRH
ncbi:MAG: hypothetical protein JJE42_01315 [Burkholderiales bacterium]|nr:hypothetical protein [Burkholderiales bacterium]